MKYFEIPVPPSVNTLYANVKGHGRVKTTESRQYQEIAGWAARAWAMENEWEYGGGRIEMHLRIWFPTRHRRDITNCIKIAEDSVANALGFDDTVVDKFTVERAGYDKENPRALIGVRELD